MKVILFDTNIVLDVLLDREPFVKASAAAWAAIESGIAQGMLAAHAVTTIYDLVQKELGAMKAKRILSGILKVFRVATVDGQVLHEAMQYPIADFEDAVTAAAAVSSGCDCIVTRDLRHFRGSPLLALSPEAVLPLLSARRNHRTDR
jgi:predicted nucleic acid-binding protein